MVIFGICLIKKVEHNPAKPCFMMDEHESTGDKKQNSPFFTHSFAKFTG
jgi:hypothetical protein